MMVTDLRSMGPSSVGAYPIESASTSSIVFFSDVDENGVFDRVRYFLATSTATSGVKVVKKGIIKPIGNPYVYVASSEIVSTVVQNVVTSTEPLFQYYASTFTGSEASLTSPIDIPSVRILKITVYADLSPRAPRPLLFSDTVTMRNLKTN